CGQAAPRRTDAFVLHVRIAGDGHLAQAGAVVYGGDHFQKGALGIAAIDVVAADDDVFQAFVSPLVGDVTSEFVVANGARDVRLGGEDVMLAAFFIRGGNGFELILDVDFVGGGGRMEVWEQTGRLGQNRKDKSPSATIFSVLCGISPRIPR